MCIAYIKSNTLNLNNKIIDNVGHKLPTVYKQFSECNHAITWLNILITKQFTLGIIHLLQLHTTPKFDASNLECNKNVHMFIFSFRVSFFYIEKRSISIGDLGVIPSSVDLSRMYVCIHPTMLHVSNVK